MATYGKKLLDNSGNVILPKTRSSLVYMDDNTTVEKAISNILDGTSVVETSQNIKDANIDTIYSLYTVDQSNPTANTGVAIWDPDVNASRPIDRAVNDVNAKPIHTTYMSKAGGTFTGTAIANSTNRSGEVIRNIGVKNSAAAFVSTNLISCYRE